MLWYTPTELAKRIGFYHSCQSIGSIVSGLLTTAIHETMDGYMNLAGWRWCVASERVPSLLSSSADLSCPLFQALHHQLHHDHLPRSCRLLYDPRSAQQAQVSSFFTSSHSTRHYCFQARPSRLQKAQLILFSLLLPAPGPSGSTHETRRSPPLERSDSDEPRPKTSPLQPSRGPSSSPLSTSSPSSTSELSSLRMDRTVSA